MTKVSFGIELDFNFKIVNKELLHRLTYVMKLINTEVRNKHCKPMEQMMYSFSDTTMTFS
jgi:hypothetical protein